MSMTIGEVAERADVNVLEGLIRACEARKPTWECPIIETLET